MPNTNTKNNQATNQPMPNTTTVASNTQTTTINASQAAKNQMVINTTTTNNKTGQTTNKNQLIQTTNGEVLAETTNTNLPSLLSQKGYKKMGEFLNLAGLTQKLSDAPHTVFAPSDEAWNQFLKREANVYTNDKAKNKMNQVLQNNKQKEQFLEKLRGILFFQRIRFPRKDS